MNTIKLPIGRKKKQTGEQEARLYRKGNLFAITKLHGVPPAVTHLATGYMVFECRTVAYARKILPLLESCPVIAEIFADPDPKAIKAKAENRRELITHLRSALRQGVAITLPAAG